MMSGLSTTLIPVSYTHLDVYKRQANYYAVKAAEYIERHYTMPVSVDEIAQAAGVSRKHLYAVFREIMRISPKQYLIYYRIEKAGHKPVSYTHLYRDA